jgi:hypothetical protein
MVSSRSVGIIKFGEGDGQITPRTRASSGASQSDQSMADADIDSDHEPVTMMVRMVGTPVSNSCKKATGKVVVTGRRKSKRNAANDPSSDDDDDEGKKSVTVQRGKKQKVDRFALLYEKFPGSHLLPHERQEHFLVVMENADVASAAKVDLATIPNLHLPIAQFRADALTAQSTFGKTTVDVREPDGAL